MVKERDGISIGDLLNDYYDAFNKNDYEKAVELANKLGDYLGEYNGVWMQEYETEEEKNTKKAMALINKLNLGDRLKVQETWDGSKNVPKYYYTYDGWKVKSFSMNQVNAMLDFIEEHEKTNSKLGKTREKNITSTTPVKVIKREATNTGKRAAPTGNNSTVLSDIDALIKWLDKKDKKR